MNRWDSLTPAGYDFDISDLAALAQHSEYLRNQTTLIKQPHQLLEADLVNWNTVEYNRYTFVRANQKSPYATIWDYVEPPVGTYRWDRGIVGNIDAGLAKLGVVNLSDLAPYGAGRFQWDMREQSKVDSYSSLYIDGPTMASGNPTPIPSLYIDPIKVYVDGNGRKIILDGYKRWKAAQAAGLTQLKAWIYQTTGDATMNRTLYMQAAVTAGQQVPTEEFNIPALGPSVPIYAPTLDYATLRKVSYPAIGDQLDAIFDFLANDDGTKLASIRQQIQTIKNRFPKDSA